MIREFELKTRGFELVTRGSEVVLRGFELITRGFELVTRRFELVTRGFETFSSWFELITCRFETFLFFSFGLRYTLTRFLCLLTYLSLESFVAFHFGSHPVSLFLFFVFFQIGKI